MADKYVDFEPTEVLKLLVEQEPTGVVNRVQNPSGEMGGYGWVSPVIGSVIRGVTNAYTSYQKGLEYTSATTTGGNYFYTENMPVTVGQYVAASWHVNYTPYNRYRVRIDWLDITGALLSSSAYTNFTTSYADHVLAPIVVPASAAYARLRFEMGGSGGTYPYNAGGVRFSIRSVAFMQAATTTALGTVRTNLLTNPSAETVFTGWTGIVSNPTWSMGRATTLGGFVGSNAFVGSRTGGTGDIGIRLFTRVNVTAGQDYSFSFYGKAGTTARSYVARIMFYNSTGTLLGTFSGAPVSVTSAGWSRVSVAGITAPVGATTADVQAVVQTPGNGENHAVDALLFEQSATVGTYFDGSTAAGSGWSYSWTGTAHTSTSTAFTSNASFIEPIPYTDILSPAHEINIVREELNLGTLTATILSEDLDPATGDTIRPGRRVRFMGLNGTTQVYEPLFVGKILNAEVTYDYRRKNENPEETKYTRIVLTAVDAVQTLASVSRPRGVGKVSDLAYVLEGAGVPWAVNGDSNQVPTATVVSRNDDFTALDQIAITRDSNLGYAWVDRFGVLQARSAILTEGGDKITNGGFETGTPPTGWWITGAGGTPVLGKATGGAQEGTYFASLVASSAGTQTQMQVGTHNPASSFRGSIPVVPGQTYNLYAWFKTETTPRNCVLYVDWWDEAGTSSVYISSSGDDWNVGGSIQDNNTGWTFIQKTVIAPPNATACEVYAGVVVSSGTMAASERHFIDGFQMRPVFDDSAANYYDEEVYSDLDVSFSTDDCINEVTIKYLRYNKKSKSTEEIFYGPYRDQASVDEWGLHPAEFTVQWETEDALGLAFMANSILSANKTPEVRVNSVRIPIRTLENLDSTRAFVDLYDYGFPYNDEKAIGDASLITRIEHNITPEGWLLDLVFSSWTAVAVPQATPSVQGRADTIGSGPATVPVGGIQMFAGDTGDIPTGWLNCDGAAVSRTTYANLFAVIGTTFGSGNGSTTFNVPDMRRRAPMGVGTSRLLGEDDGQTEANRTPAHSHTVDAHDHGLAAGTTAATQSGTGVQRMTGAGTTGTRSPGTSNAGGFTGANGFPNLTLNFIIKA